MRKLLLLPIAIAIACAATGGWAHNARAAWVPTADLPTLQGWFFYDGLWYNPRYLYNNGILPPNGSASDPDTPREVSPDQEGHIWSGEHDPDQSIVGGVVCEKMPCEGPVVGGSSSEPDPRWDGQLPPFIWVPLPPRNITLVYHDSGEASAGQTVSEPEPIAAEQQPSGPDDRIDPNTATDGYGNNVSSSDTRSLCEKLADPNYNPDEDSSPDG